MRVVISGIPGVGKSTILDLVSKKSDYRIINFGSLMLEIAKKETSINSRDDIRKLDIETQKHIQRLTSNELGRMNNIIIDTHMSIKSPSGYFPGLPEWVLHELNVSSFFLIESKPEEIKKRRDNDKTRSRDSDTVEDIGEHQEINRYYAAAYSVYSGATVNFICNQEGNPEIAADNIVTRLDYATETTTK